MRLNNLLKIGLLAAVFLTLSAAPVFAHVDWTSPSQNQQFNQGTAVTARAKTDDSDCSYAVFEWSKTGAGGGWNVMRTTAHLPVLPDTYVSDTYTPSEAGEWKVEVNFYDSSDHRVDHGHRNFRIIAVPEFPLGLPIVLLLASSIYLITRRRLE